MYDEIRMLMNTGDVFGYFLEVIPITCVVGLTYVVLRLIYLKRTHISIVWSKEVMKALFICYLTGLFNLIVMPAGFWLTFFDGIAFGSWNEMGPLFSFGGYNLIPAIVKWLRHELTIGSWVKTMLIGNVTMFIPFGFFIPFVSEHITVRKVWGIAIVVPLSMELLQMCFGRSFDIDDLICNFLGIVIGFFIATVIKIAMKYFHIGKRKKRL